MIADKILSALEGVRQTGDCRWIARCPAHDDRSPSLSIRATDDRLLIHCFAGCSAYEVVSAVGLELDALFPESVDPVKGGRPLSRPFPATHILKCLAFESLVNLFCAEAMARGETLEQRDRDRLLQSAARFRAAIQAGD